MPLIITETEVLLREDEVSRPIDDIHNYLWMPVELEGKVTLKRLFELVAPLADFWGIMLNENVTALIAEMSTTPAESVTDLVALVVCWQLERQEDSLTLTDDFSGQDEQGTLCAVEFYSVNKLGTFPVKIEKEFKLFDWDSQKLTTIGMRSPRLIELFKAIFYELSFFGSPEAREVANLELEQAFDDIRNGRSSELPFEDL